MGRAGPGSNGLGLGGLWALGPAQHITISNCCSQSHSRNQYENMQTYFNDIVSGYDATPLKAHTNSELEDIDMQKRWVGSNGDHAADQKKSIIE